ncbi:relaxase/mobilization nuclease domain-containing protein [Nocardioides sp.]|uniref:relaxase/mobilization nuclease domain-containing protein n=1 Tax=Nocardioides sp. TaxID=35761 RepID=UPI002EDB69FA
MIAVSSSGRSFRALASYLATGRTGRGSDRVAWSEGRNIPTDRPELAAEIMHHTAAGRRDERVAQPVYHVAISFDLKDRPTRSQMRQVADRMLEDLGLGGHQALIVAHRDRAHQHVHILVNRIHPETGKAWDRWQEKARTEQSLREQEKALGFREVAGRLYQVEGREPPDRAPLTNPERRERGRSAEPIFVERVRADAPRFWAAASWDALETALAERGLRLERKGQGLVITDGQREVKASRVHRDLSLCQLEARYGVRYGERHQASEPNRAQEERRARGRAGAGEIGAPDREGVPVRVRYVATRIRQFERATRIEHALSAAGTALDRAEARVRAHGATLGDRDAARDAFAQSLRGIYRDPSAARTSFVEAVTREGAERAIGQLRESPQRFGSLRATEQQPGMLVRLGLSRNRDDLAARQATGHAADRAARMIAAERAVPSDRELEGAKAGLARALARHDHLRAVAEQLPLRGRLAAHLARAVGRLSEREWVLLRGTLTPREIVIGDVVREAVRGERDKAQGLSPAATRDGADDSPRARHVRARLAGAAVHRIMAQITPRELRQVARAVEAISSPGLALKRAIRDRVREAILGGTEHER